MVKILLEIKFSPEDQSTATRELKIHGVERSLSWSGGTINPGHTFTIRGVELTVANVAHDPAELSGCDGDHTILKFRASRLFIEKLLSETDEKWERIHL